MLRTRVITALVMLGLLLPSLFFSHKRTGRFWSLLLLVSVPGSGVLCYAGVKQRAVCSVSWLPWAAPGFH